jgi:dimethylhistidine N-methyltransferase
LRGQFPDLTVTPVVADYTSGLPQLRMLKGRKLVLYIGSSIGNFEPMEASAVLAKIRQSLSPGDALLLGADLAKDPQILVPAYDDETGVTARFNKNLLARINRELGGHFDLELFRHIAEWNPAESRMQMFLESTRRQSVMIDLLDNSFDFAAGERIHTENSYKFTQPMIASVLENGGFELEQMWTDRRNWFGLYLARVAEG